MARLQLIENALISINETVFQELCDAFLIFRNSNYRAFSRVGSQTGKQKTIKGTPDTFLLLPNGKYIFVEYSTNVSSNVSKLKDDISKCLDYERTGINPNQISEIIICINFNLKIIQIEDLRDQLSQTRILLTIYTLDSLALELHLNHRDLANQYLQIPLSTGQIISIENFIEEYNKASRGISTPLTNTFVHREAELQNLIETLKTYDFIILTGAPGVGKTKLAIEAMQEFLKNNSSYDAYCVSYKNYSLLEDLYQVFAKDKNYLLFVDDANRIDAFNQITGFYKSIRNGKLKIIITVRDYAYQEISYLCQDFMPKRIDISKFNDDQIVDIIKEKPFEILNPDFQKPIISIADGNPRIAIMTSMLAKEKQDINALFDLSDLFERYFQTFTRDDGEFAKAINVKCLGLIAFFYAMPYKNKDIVSEILENFQIEYDVFVEVIDKLEKLELVEIQFDYVKIPEQNLSTYFFYKAFIKDKTLSFATLLNKYFDENIFRFRDSVIPANNTFGSGRVMDVLRPDLKQHYELIKTDYDRSYKFLSTFWFYLEDETLNFIFKKIRDLPQLSVTEYSIHYENNVFSYDKDAIIALISEFYRNHENLKTAVELSIEYVRKNPLALAELIHKCTESFSFDRDDEKYGFFRQMTLLEVLIDGSLQNDIICVKLFYELSKSFLNFKFHHTKGARHNSIYFYDYYLPPNKYTKQYRNKIWTTINKIFNIFPDESINLLQDYSNPKMDVVKSIMKDDISSIMRIIETHLDRSNFLHCKFVHDLIYWARKNSIKNPLFELLTKEFTNSTYTFYTNINWDRFKNREMYEFDDFSEYEKLKEDEIRKNFTFTSLDEINLFYKTFLYLKSLSNNDWNYIRSLEIILDQNSTNFEISIKIIEAIINDDNQINYYPRTYFHNQLKSFKKAETIYRTLNENDFKGKETWLLTFFEYIDQQLININYANDLIDLVHHGNFNYIQFDNLEKYLQVRPNLFQEILKIIVVRNEQENLKIQLWLNTFEKHFENFGDDIDLIKKAYIQQDKIQQHFDFDGKSFLKIINVEPDFLFQYIKSQYQDGEFRISSDTKNLGFIWEVENIEKVVEKVFDFVIHKEPYFGINSHFCNSFYKHLNPELKLTAEKFLIEYATKHCNNTKTINVLVDIVRNSMRNLYEHFILMYVELNQDVNAFSKIAWRGNSTMASGDVILSDIIESDWRNISSILNKSPLGIKLYEIKSFVNMKIEHCIESGIRERQRRFLSRY